MYAKLRNFLNKNHMIVKSCISGSLLGFSDYLQQKFIEKQQFDYKRNLQFLAFGLLWFGPLIQIWYSKLLPKITTKYFSNFPNKKQIIYRLIVDSAIFGPSNVIGFYLLKQYIDYRSLQHLKQNKKQFFMKIYTTLALDQFIWVPANYINFKYIPIIYQGVYVGFFNVVYSIGLSFITHNQMNKIWDNFLDRFKYQ